MVEIAVEMNLRFLQWVRSEAHEFYNGCAVKLSVSLAWSRVILQMAAWASVKMVTVPSAWLLDAATRRALAIVSSAS